MPDSTIDSELIQLAFNQWGAHQRFGWIPDDGFTGTGTTGQSGGFNSTTAVHPVGMCVVTYQDGVAAGTPGYTEWTYLQVGTENAANTLAAKDLCTQDSATLWYQVTNDPDDNILVEGGLAAYALGDIANSSYGWFWTGGVCPEDPKYFNGSATPMSGNFVTDGTAVAGPKNIVSNCSADVLGVGVGGTDEKITIHLLAADA